MVRQGVTLAAVMLLVTGQAGAQAAASVARLRDCEYDGSCNRGSAMVRVGISDSGLVVRGVERFRASQRVRVVLHGINPFRRDTYTLRVTTRTVTEDDGLFGAVKAILGADLPKALFTASPMPEAGFNGAPRPPVAPKARCANVAVALEAAVRARALFDMALIDGSRLGAATRLRRGITALATSNEVGTGLADDAVQVVRQHAEYPALRQRARQMARADSALRVLSTLPPPMTVGDNCAETDEYRSTITDVIQTAARERAVIAAIDSTAAFDQPIVAIRQILVTPSVWTVQQEIGAYDKSTIATIQFVRIPPTEASLRPLYGDEAPQVRDAIPAGADTLGSVEMEFVSRPTVTFAIGGVAAMLGTAEYAVIASPDSGRRIGVARNDRWRTPVVGLLHVRLPLLARRGAPFSLSGGAALASNSSNLSDRDWLLGASVALARERLFLTWGAVLGQTVRIDDAWRDALARRAFIPASVTTIPTTRERRFSQFFGVSLRSPKLPG